MLGRYLHGTSERSTTRAYLSRADYRPVYTGARRTPRHNVRMGWGEPIYTPAQRAAVIYHRNVRNIPGTAVVDLARRGELEAPSGQTLDPFDIPKSTVYSIAREDHAKRKRQEVSALVEALPADANEEIRRRLVEIVDRKTAKLIDRARRGRDEIDTEELRKLARAAREIAAMPAHGLRAPQPGRQASGAPDGEYPAKANSAAGALFDAARGKRINAKEPALGDPLPSDENGAAASIEERAAAAARAAPRAADSEVDAMLRARQEQEQEQQEPVDTGQSGAGSRARSALARLPPLTIAGPQQQQSTV